jgi:DNA-binding CsgD family transcriptional regulator
MDTTRLTPRQREVLDLLAKRYSNQQIADALGISLDGAKWHVREVLAAMDVSTREEAAERWRIENGLPRRLWRMTWSAGQVAALLGGLAAILVVAVAAFVALRGDGGEPPASPDPTRTPTTASTSPAIATTSTAIATLAATRPPGVLAPPSRVTGVEFIDYVTAHLESNVSLQFADLEGQLLPCSAEVYVTAPRCPPGAAAGTPVLSIITFQCEIGWNEFTPDLHVSLPEDRLALHSVVRGGAAYTRPPAADAAPDYWMLFTNAEPNLPPGFAVAVKNRKIVSFGRSCGTFESLETRLTAGSAGYLLTPP